MGDGPLERIEGVFGWRGFPHALFYKAAFALRFELAGDVEAAPLRFMKAMDRARTIADLAFAKSGTLTAIVSHYGLERRTRRDSASFKRLVEIGFPFPFAGPDRVSADEELHRYWYSSEFHKSDKPVTALLWAALEPIRKEVESEESVVIQGATGGRRACGHRIIVEPPIAAGCVTRAT